MFANLFRRRTGTGQAPPLSGGNPTPPVEKPSTAPKKSDAEASASPDDDAEEPTIQDSRPFTRTNLRIALEKAQHSLPAAALLVVRLCGPWRSVLLILQPLKDGVLPTWQAWANGELMNIVQHSFTVGRADRSELVKFALLKVSVSVLNLVLSSVFERNSRICRTKVDHAVEMQYLSVQLQLDLPSLSDPHIASTMHDAGIFAVEEHGFPRTSIGHRNVAYPVRNHWTPFESLKYGFLGVLTQAVAAVSSVSLLASVTRSTLAVSGGSPLQSFLFVFLAFLSPLISLVDDIFSGEYRWYYNWNDPLRRDQRKTRELATDGDVREEVLLFGLRGWILERYDKIAQLLSAKSHSAEDWTMLRSMMTRTVREVDNVLFYASLAFQGSSSSISLGTIGVYTTTTSKVLQNGRGVYQTLGDSFQVIFFMSAYFDLPNVRGSMHPVGPPAVYETATGRDGKRGMSIEARDMDFTYPKSSTPVLERLSLKIEPGETVAVVGNNGSGKTTLVKILLRLLDYSSGELLINGIDARRFEPAVLHSHTTVAFQEFARLDLSARINIGIGHSPLMDSVSAVQDAALKGGAADFLGKLPKRYETQLSSRPGAESTSATVAPVSRPTGEQSEEVKAVLSGGQWRKLALARAFLHPDCDLVVLDEPSSSLDAEAEHALFQRIRTLAANCTTIYISHRFSTVRKADKILFVEQGRIVEAGTHDELIQLDGRYAHMFNLQAEAFR